jgi:hypothetical protein
VIGRFSYDSSKSNINPVLDEAGSIIYGISQKWFIVIW